MPSRKVRASSNLPHYCEATAVARKTIGDSTVSHDHNGVYTSRIIKAGALIADTVALLENWDETQSTKQNLARLQSENIFGKATRSRINDILQIFRQRYLDDKQVSKALVRLVKNRFPKPSLDRILYFHSCEADRLLHDLVTEVLYDRYERGRTDVHVNDVHQVLVRWVHEGKTAARWSESTTRRIAQGLLATLRDFSVLQGAKNKRLAPPSLPVSAFSYVAFYLQTKQASGELLLNHKDWALFFLSPTDVERYFIQAHQHKLLEYYAAGPVIRITFPSDSLEEYARVISEGPI